MKGNKVDVEGFAATVTKVDPSKIDLAREVANVILEFVFYNI